MAGFPSFPTPFEEPVLNPGVSPEWEGVVLQRGSEELVLEKLNDRFSVHLIHPAPETLAQQLQAQSVVPLASTGLVEVQVEVDRLDQAMQLARSSETIRFASHVYQMKKSPGTWLYLSDQLTIQFVEQVAVERIRAIAARFGLQVIKLVPGVAKAFVFQVTQQATANPLKLANRLLHYSEVLLAEPNIVVPLQRFHPDESDEASSEEEAQNSLQSWYLDHEGGEDLAVDSHISAKAAWEITQGVRSVAVAIVDRAIDLNDPGFQAEGKIVAPFGEIEQQAETSSSDAPTHGTICARLAVAERSETGSAGVAPDCALMPIAIGDWLDDQSVEQVFEWALEKGAAVVACGWGAGAVYFPLSLRQRVALARTAKLGREGKGCAIVFAAGNANRPLDGVIHEQGWENALLQGEIHWFNGFAVHPDVIAVSASTSLNQKAVYSNWGNSLSVVTPRENQAPSIVLSQTGTTPTQPLISGALSGRRAADPDRSTADLQSESDERSEASIESLGTSGASAIVAGVAALMLSINPELTAREVKQLLQETADKIVDPKPDSQLGLEQGAYNAQGQSQWFGYGKVNALRAVQAAQQSLFVSLPADWIEQQNTHWLEIPDNDPAGVTSAIEISDRRLVWDVEISVQIEHSFVSDLEIYLISPQSKTILLQSRTAGRLSPFRRTYSLQNVPTLQALLGRSAEGKWQLKLVDCAPSNTGRLNRWQLRLGV